MEIDHSEEAYNTLSRPDAISVYKTIFKKRCLFLSPKVIEFVKRKMR